MRSFCINLKYLALIVLLSLSWMAPTTLHSVITSQGNSVFRNAIGQDGNPVSPFGGFQSRDYPYPGLPVYKAPFTPDQNIVQIQWGNPAFPEITDELSSYILYPAPYDYPPPPPPPLPYPPYTPIPPDPPPNPLEVTLGEAFEVSRIQHINRPIRGTSFLTEFEIQITVDLIIEGSPLPESFVFDNIKLLHNETLNPLADVATWDTDPMNRDFNFGGIDYTLTLLGISPDYDPNCEGQCFITVEFFENSAPILAVLNAQEIPIPEPSTYLIMGSMIGIVIFCKYRMNVSKRSKKTKSIEKGEV